MVIFRAVHFWENFPKKNNGSKFGKKSLNADEGSARCCCVAMRVRISSGRDLFQRSFAGELWLSGGFAAGLLNDVWRSSDAVNWRVGFSREITAP
jgi:hypothetical protein